MKTGSLARLFCECYKKIGLLPVANRNFKYKFVGLGHEILESACPLVAFLIASGSLTVINGKLSENIIFKEMDIFDPVWASGFIDGFDDDVWDAKSNNKIFKFKSGFDAGCKVRRTFQRMGWIS